MRLCLRSAAGATAMDAAGDAHVSGMEGIAQAAHRDETDDVKTPSGE